MESKSWRVTSCSVQGSSHIKSDLPCQDYSEWQSPKGEVLIAAVADGAGSASESLRGAGIACKTAIALLEQSPERLDGLSEDGCKELISKAFAAARSALVNEADIAKLPLRELACTLILLIATRSWAIAGQVGDGAALVMDETGQMQNLTRPAETEYLNQTTFLTAEDALQALQVETYSGAVQSVAMFTDGLQMLALKMPDAKPHTPFFTPLFKFLNSEADDVVRMEQVQKFLASPRITQRADDDLTLLLASLVKDET